MSDWFRAMLPASEGYFFALRFGFIAILFL